MRTAFDANQGAAARPRATERVILDTDIDTDCDDAGALAVLHNLAGRGMVEILGVVCCVPSPWCAPFVHALNRWYGRGGIPVGEARVPDWESSPVYTVYHEERTAMSDGGRIPLYNEAVARAAFPSGDFPANEEGTALYRRLLAAQPDRSVTLCAIGMLTVLAQLLRTGPDTHSPLPGSELVRRKVARLVTMAKAAPLRGEEEFNWRMDLPAARTVVSEWPTPLIVSDHGETVRTGKRFLKAVPEEHPAAVAYRSVLSRTGEEDRPSWDQLAVAWSAGAGDKWLRATGHGSIVLDEQSAEYVWTAERGPADRQCLVPIVSDTYLQGEVETLMIGGH